MSSTKNIGDTNAIPQASTISDNDLLLGFDAESNAARQFKGADIKEQLKGDPGPEGPDGPTGPKGPAGAGVPTGGNPGDVLIKESTADHDFSWASPLNTDFDMMAAMDPDIFILVGQSNMVGYAHSGSTPTNSSILQYSATGPQAGRRLISSEPLLHPDGGGPAGSIGPAQTFALDHLAATGRPVLLVPAAWQGTGLGGQWVNPTGQQFRDSLALSAGAIARSAGAVKGFLLCQGEADVGVLSPARYLARLESLIIGLRGHIHGATDAPFLVLSMVPEWIAQQGALASDIDAMHRLVATRIPRTAFVEGATGTDTDIIHYNAAQQIENGHNLYAALATATANDGRADLIGWDANVSHEDVVISGNEDDVCGRNNTASWVMTRSKQYKSTGRWYAEIEHLNGYPWCGIAAGSSPENQPLNGVADRNAGINTGNGYIYPGSTFTGLPQLTAGDILGIDADIDREIISFNINNGAWCEPISIAAVGVPICLAAAFPPNTADGSVRLISENNFLPPSGARPWYG